MTCCVLGLEPVGVTAVNFCQGCVHITKTLDKIMRVLDSGHEAIGHGHKRMRDWRLETNWPGAALEFATGLGTSGSVNHC